MHLTIGIFGDMELARRLGKAGTVNDIAIFNHASSEGVFTYVCPANDKIQPLLQVLSMIDVPVIVANEMTKEIGEMIIAISEYGFDKGFVITKDVQSFSAFSKGTCIESFKFVEDEKELREALKLVNMTRPTEKVIVPIDNYFDVRSVGTVVLAIIKSGKVSKHDNLLLEPIGIKVNVKSIQSQDKDIDSAEAGTRVGLSIKGVNADELKRGYVLTNEMKKASSLKLRFSKSKYYRDEIGENEQVIIAAGLRAVVGTARISGDEIEIKADSQLAYDDSTKFIIASTKQKLPRIIGTALPFASQSRET